MDLMALLEQAEILTQAWRAVPAGPLAVSLEDCPTLDQLRAYAGGGLEAGQAGKLLDHLAACSRCRHELRALARRLGLSGLPVDLEQLRQDLERQHPEASAALARLAQAIDGLLAEEQPAGQGGRGVELGLRGPDGLPSGHWACFTLRRPPYIDHHKRLRLDLREVAEAPQGCWVRLLLRHQGQDWDLGASPLEAQARELLWDLADLPIRPGYLPWECLRLSAEQRPGGAEGACLADSLGAEMTGQAVSMTNSPLMDLRAPRVRDPEA
ncbi:MAG: hypothetical protein HY794_12895 [Desulfarculus sp.]|nr:hypothetical protein [Desulfarculus sp.]